MTFLIIQKRGFPFLPTYMGSEVCQSYLLALPGSLLADIYDKYGERLLEQNVRTFLQFRGKVNKGIRNTLTNEPEMFFAYNIGLTVTAEDVEIVNTYMTAVKNLQIVNGGQTTASIFMSKLQNKKGIDLDKVFIQVKLSVIDSEKVDDVVPLISQYANTQNKVNAADFFSNHPYHKRIEDFSRRMLAPSAVGGLTETHWYYERARGQYANAQTKMTKLQKNKFLNLNPKNQMFTKTDLAKYENSFAELPHFVSKGAQWNFGKFAESIGGNDNIKGIWEKDNTHINELYFKNLIAKAIIFNYLDKNMMQQNWYGGYKANIVTYSIAKFSNIVKELGLSINFQRIWEKQNISDAFKRQLIDIAEIINREITDTPLNVTQYCKHESCWYKIRDKVQIILNDDVIDELRSKGETLDEKRSAKKQQKMDNGIAYAGLYL